MPSNQELMELVAQSICTKDTAVLAHLAPNAHASAAEQLAIYQDAYATRLLTAVWSDYSGLCHYLGDEAFDRLAQAYVVLHVPQSYSLDGYAHGFAAYLQKAAIPEEAKALADYEAMHLRLRTAPDSEPLKPGFVPADAMMTRHYALRSESVLAAFDFAVDRFMKDFRDLKNPTSIARFPTYLLLLREQDEIKTHALDFREYALLKGLVEKKPLAELVQQDALLTTEMATDFMGKWLKNNLLVRPHY